MRHFPCVLLLVACLWHYCSGQAAPTATSARPVSSSQEFLAALKDPDINSIAVMKPFSMPHNTSRPAVVNRQLLITSPHRAMINWCDEGCIAGQGPKAPFIILGQGAVVTFNRLFFRNFVPHSSSYLNNTALDFIQGPVPFIVSRDGGQATYNLVVLHWTPPMFWVFSRKGTFWHAAAEEEIKPVGEPQPLQFQRPELYVVKSFATDTGTATITDCYMPLDVHSCLKHQPFDTTLVYCPYTFKDSLRNPWVSKVVVFHDVGLDRLVNSYRNPALVDRPIVYASCPGTQHTMDLDNITNSVLVTAGGSLTFKGLVLQGSKSQNKTDWPSSIPLLLSTFKPVESGTIIVRDSVLKVKHMDDMIRALNKLPSGSFGAVEVPDLQPTYHNNKPPKPGDTRFTIKLWQLQRQRWLLARVGGSTIMDRMGSTASWQFFNVTAEAGGSRDCFGAAVVQGSLVKGQYSMVSTGQQLLDQLGNVSARYIRVMNSLTVPIDQPRVTVSRIVEVRACTDAGAFTIDWGNLHDAVMVTGNAMLQGNLLLTGIGWSPELIERKELQLVDALHPAGTGIVEYEDLELVATMPPEHMQSDNGRSNVASLLGVKAIETLPLNMSLTGPSQLLLRGFYTNESLETNGADGVESFVDVALRWSAASGGLSNTSRTNQTLMLAAIIPAVIGSVIAALALGVFLCRYIRARRCSSGAAAGKQLCQSPSTNGSTGGGKDGCGPVLPALGSGSCFGLGPAKQATKQNTQPGNSSPEGSSPLSSSSDLAGTAAGHDDHKDGLGGKDDQGDNIIHVISGVSSSGSLSKSVRSGPSEEIAQACKSLVSKKSFGQDDELVLQSVLGEGSYGKVFKATWRGTGVAVKIMILPSFMSGKEKRERMAVMETAISSSLSHPNVVQTYTYSVEPVRSNTKLKDRQDAEGPGARLSLHDSTLSWKAGREAEGFAGNNNGRDKKLERNSGEKASGTFSWEVRLVQEFCDLGSLRDAFKQNKDRFRTPSGALHMSALVDTALDIARAMAHLHKHNILHSDLKARNVLLRSDVQDPRGFTAKVADFGLSITIDPNCTHVSDAYQGTMTHMAPETLMHGHISRASDVYGFGILMWELFTGDHAYKSIPRALLGHNITKQGMRPVFPAETPFEWQFLACRCWETDPAIRPTFEQILEELKRMKDKWVANGSPTSSGSLFCSLPLSSQQPATSGALSSIPSPLAVLRASVMQQHQGRLPSIEDTSDRLPAVDNQQVAEQQQQQVTAGPTVAPTAPGAVHTAMGAAAGQAFGQHMANHAASSPQLQWQQQQQGHAAAAPVATAVTLYQEEASRDALVLLSCDTLDSVAQ